MPALPPHMAFPAPPTNAFSDDPARQALAAGNSRMLIVDADARVLSRVAEMAVQLGFSTTMARDVVDALWFLTKQEYRIVIASDDLPSIDGYQLALKIKRKHMGTVVFIMTRHRHPMAVGEGDPGAVIDGWLYQPFDLLTLREQICRIDAAYRHTKRTSPQR